MPNKKPLTAAFVKNHSKPGRYYDNQNTGLHLYIRQTGTKSWVQRTRLYKKPIEIGLGSVDLISLRAAREIALENSRLVRDGIDPRRQRKSGSETKTFQQIAEEALETKCAELSNHKHIDQWYSTLRNYAYPALGELPVGDVTVDDVHKALKGIWKTKNETAQRTRGRIEYVLNFAITKGYASQPNPAAWKGNLENLLPKPSKVQKSQKMPAVQQEDIQRWWKELKQRDGNGAKALQLLTLIGARSGEVRGMRFSELKLFSDEEVQKRGYLGIWTIPASRMKGGNEHQVPITQQMFELIEEQRGNQELVFPSANDGELSDMTLSALMKRMHDSDAGPFVDAKTNRPAVPHGLRSTFRDWAGENEKSREIVELQLGHRLGNKAEKAYWRSHHLDQRAKLMMDWHCFLEGSETL